MATMVKEKRREKKKTKEKHVVKTVLPEVPLEEEHSNLSQTPVCEVDETTLTDVETLSQLENVKIDESYQNVLESETNLDVIAQDTIEDETRVTSELSRLPSSEQMSSSLANVQHTALHSENVVQRVDDGSLQEDYAVEAILGTEVNTNEAVIEDVTPSAPIFEFDEPEIENSYLHEHRATYEVPKLLSMPLEEAINMYYGTEMAHVMAISRVEEAAVETGPLSGPEHPLVDLLTTFKRSLIAVERERTNLTRGFMEEEKSRAALWKVEKRELFHTEECSCAKSVYFKGTYEVARLQQEKLPAARLRLEGLLRDVQESYCHHQHAALLAHCQIEEFISETVQGSIGSVREALSLVLGALRLSDGGPGALAGALRRWAAALAAALLRGPEFSRQLLFLIHHLFRQSMSVQWAARALDFEVGDAVSAARTIALLDLLLTRPAIDSAVECVEDKEGEWEEVDKDGSGGGVSDGTLRERDMLALLRAFPLRGLVASLVLLPPSDIGTAREWGWADARGGRDVLRACCGARALLHVLTRASRAHAHYGRVRALLRRLARSLLRALAALHDHTRSSYAKDMELKVQAELEAVFAACVGLSDPADLHRLPAALLSLHAARDYCIGQIVNLHDASGTRVESLSLEMAPLACDVRVRVVTSAAVGRPGDYELARIVLEFLFTTGIRSSSTSGCAGACRAEARAQLPRLLAAHAHLYGAALLLVADTAAVEKLEPTSIDCLHAQGWRPCAEDVRAVADDWARRCPQLLPPLLLAMDYTPHTGVSLESQLAIGSWLCSQVPSRSPAEVQEWCWAVLARLRPHRACWGLPPDAPPPDPTPNHVFTKAFALMASSWGHCVPVICSEGVEALCSLAAARLPLALHCLAPIMLLLAPAHDSIALTPKFGELFGIILSASPSLVQRALGRGGDSGADLLLRLVREQLAEEHCGGVPRSALVRAWIAALWRPTLLPALTLLDAALAPRPQRHQLLDAHAAQLARAQDEETLQQLATVMKLAGQAPLACCSALHAWHAQRELLPGLYPRLLDALHAQRLAPQRIHVDNALKLLGVGMSADELVVYRCAGAALAAAPRHPAHLQLWRLLLHLYLQRPPADMRNTTPPVGPMFFSGLIKSRTLAQLKRRLQDTIKYHHNEAIAISDPVKPITRQSTSRITQSEPRSADNSLLSMLTIGDLTGEGSDSDHESEPSEEEEGEAEEGARGQDPVEVVHETNEEAQDAVNLKAYHIGAERMLSAYAQWLDEGEQVGAAQHLADIARFIPDQALAAAWQRYGRSCQPPLSAEARRWPLPLPAAPPPPAAPYTPFRTALDAVLAIRDRRRRSRRLAVKSAVEDVQFRDSRTFLALVDKHLQDIERLAQEWCSEVSRISSLDAGLWKLVAELRVPRPLPVMRQACANRCEPLVYAPQKQEWCISTAAVRGVQENRSAAMACTRRLAQPRPRAARTAAALLTIARRAASGGEAADARVACERAWRAAAAVTALHAPHATAIATFFETLAERWLSADGVLCAQLVSRWCGGGLSALQRALCLALVAPARLPPANVPALHAALLRSALPPHVAFSCLSKFEMGRWAAAADSEARLGMLGALRAAVVRYSGRDDADYQMLVELLGVQSAATCTAAELCAHVRACADLMAEGAWPPPHSAHLLRAVERTACDVPLDQLGHLLRSLGARWWEARTRVSGGRHARHAAHAPHVAALLAALHRAFVAAAVRESYAPERVAAYAWSSLAESWGAWVAPHAAEPLLPSVAGAEAEAEAYPPMLRRFREAFEQVMRDCPGTEEHLLNQLFEWTVQTHLGVQGAPAQESRVQLSALLAELAAAPWASHQWLGENSLRSLLQVCQHGDKEMCAWSGRCCDGQTAATWLRGAGHDLLPARLALLLYLLTCAPLQLAEQTLDEAMSLPWHRLPEAGLEESLDRFFMEHHSSAVPYHELPQFRVLLAASELHWSSGSGIGLSAGSRQKRARALAAWLRGASAPGRAAHVRAYQRAVLDLIGGLAPHLESSEGEVEDLLARAMIILCIEPAAAAALPVWVSWVGGACGVGGARLAAAGVRSAASLTAFEYFAPLADAALAAYLAANDVSGWAGVRPLWAGCAWSDAAPLCARGRLHAAYAALLAHAHAPDAEERALLALLAADIHFVANEVIVAVWICVACRLALRAEGGATDTRGDTTVAGGGATDTRGGAARALLARWAEPPRRSLLRVVTLAADTDRPTARHRLLCLFAQYVVAAGSPDAGAAGRAWAAAAAAWGAEGAALGAWPGAAPRLPRLALRLFPGAGAYFGEELAAASGEPA